MQTAPSPFSRGRAALLASGGTALAALLFLVVAVGSLGVNNGLFSAGIGLMLALYGAILLAIAWFGWRRGGWANGAMVASSLLHVMVGISTARGSHAWWVWLFVALAVATLVAAVACHLAEVKQRPAE